MQVQILGFDASVSGRNFRNARGAAVLSAEVFLLAITATVISLRQYHRRND